MLNATLPVLVLAATTLLAIPTLAAGPAPTPAKVTKSGHVEANGVSYYYEIRGTGEPLLVLHGGLGSIDMFQPIMPILTEKRQVIGVDLQGHGRTALGNRPIRLESMGADMAVVLDKLGYGAVDVFGYSMGGGVAFQLALQHPEKVRRVAISSAGYSQDGFYPEMLPQQAAVGSAMAAMMNETPMYKSYAAVAPHPEDFPRLLDAMGAMMREPYDWSADVPKLKMPVMLVFADSDMYRPEHVVKFYQLLGGGLRDAGWMREHMPQNRLAIIPGHTHYDLFLAPELARTVLPFLSGTTANANWGE